MAHRDAILTAVQRIHEAALAPGGWSDVLPLLATTLRTETLHLFKQHAPSGAVESIAAHGLAPGHVTDYVAAVAAGMAPKALRGLPAGVADRGSRLQSDRDFERSAFYNEVVRPMGGYYAGVASLLRSPELGIYFVAGRLLGRPDFDDEDLAALRAVVPHLAVALRTIERLRALERRGADAASAAEQLTAGAIVVDASARILLADQLAASLLDAGDGLCLGSGRLRAADSAAASALGRLIAECANPGRTNGGPGGFVNVPRRARAPLRVAVAPYRADTAPLGNSRLSSARPAAVLIITDPERGRRPRKDELRRRFGLTAAEADVALEIVKGDGREAAAARLGISLTTARTHLTHIFEKTGVNRQAALVRLLMEDGSTE